jgi:hypothetical protein
MSILCINSVTWFIHGSHSLGYRLLVMDVSFELSLIKNTNYLEVILILM